MKTTLLFTLFTLSFLSFFGFSQSLDITWATSNTFTSGNLSTTAYVDTLYLNPSESINLNVTASGNFDVFTQPYTQGATPYWGNVTWVSEMPYSYTFQTGFSDFVLYVRYQSSSVLYNMYKILVINNQTASVNESNVVDFNLYPNPTTDFLNISGVNVESVQVFDINGRMVLSETTNKVDVSALQLGIYTVLVNGEDRQHVVVE